MKKFLGSLYGKISLVFLILLLIMGSVMVMISVNSSMEFVEETNQQLNISLAKNMAREFEPYLKDSIDIAGIEKKMQSLMLLNPDIELYLLDEQGMILAYFMESGKEVKLKSVSLKPLHDFFNRSESTPIRGDDPCYPPLQKTFSAAPLRIGEDTNGYLYVILNGSQYDSVMTMLQDSYIVRTMTQILIVTIIFTAIVGLISFAFLTTRFRRMTETVKRFEQGDYSQRIEIRSHDEIDQLGRAFNQMGDTIIQHLEALRTQDRLRRDLIANISHELRSPLTSIRGYLESFLLRGMTLNEKQAVQSLETIFEHAKELNKLVNELFELSRLDANQIRPHPEPFSLPDLIQDVVLNFGERAAERNIQLRTGLPDKIPLVYGDIGMIERALSNLIDNAISFTPAGGKVNIELQQCSDKVRVEVSDTGCGIPSEDIPFVFERFYRVEKSRSRARGGAGLGLAITKKIIEAHNSVISVNSVLNQGTSFVFDLPVHV